VSAEQANFDGRTPYGRAPRTSYRAHPTPVGSFAPNLFGLYDMHGNIYEWCNDWYGERYYGHSPRRDPKGPAEGDHHVTRGGCWYEYGWVCRSAFRGHFAPGHRDRTFGARLALAWAT
jgi:formylglycine-generating enzyme required for sulfatase activity